MAIDYVYDVPLSKDAIALYDESKRAAIFSEAYKAIPGTTQGNCNVESVDIDFEMKRFSYNISLSPQMKLGLLSNNPVERMAWYDFVIMGAAVAGAVVCVVLGFPIVAAIIVGAVGIFEITSMMYRSYVKKVDAQMKILDAQQTVCTYLNHNPDVAAEYRDSVDKSWTTEFTSTIKLVLYVSIGIAVMGLISQFMTTSRKKES
jgi:hypothetical protein